MLLTGLKIVYNEHLAIVVFVLFLWSLNNEIILHDDRIFSRVTTVHWYYFFLVQRSYRITYPRFHISKNIQQVADQHINSQMFIAPKWITTVEGVDRGPWFPLPYPLPPTPNSLPLHCICTFLFHTPRQKIDPKKIPEYPYFYSLSSPGSWLPLLSPWFPVLATSFQCPSHPCSLIRSWICFNIWIIELIILFITLTCNVNIKWTCKELYFFYAFQFQFWSNVIDILTIPIVVCLQMSEITGFISQVKLSVFIWLQYHDISLQKM